MWVILMEEIKLGSLEKEKVYVFIQKGSIVKPEIQILGKGLLEGEGSVKKIRDMSSSGGYIAKSTEGIFRVWNAKVFDLKINYDHINEYFIKHGDLEVEIE